MNTFVVYALFALLLFGIFIVGVYCSLVTLFAPTPSKEAITKAKEFVGFDFGSSYQILYYYSQNNHPDMPLSLKLSFDTNDSHMVKLLEYCMQQNETATIDYENEHKISTHINIGQYTYAKRCYVEDASCGYTVFTRELIINLDLGILEYSELGS